MSIDTLTAKQRAALELYADGLSHNEKALRIHHRVYESLSKKGFIKRTAFLMSAITDRGRAALKEAGRD